MLGLALDENAEGQHRVEPARQRGPAARERQLERARNPHDLDVGVGRAAPAQDLQRALHQPADVDLVEARGHHAVPVPGRIGIVALHCHHVSPSLRSSR